MKVEELMIGDWVECTYWTPSKQLKVAEIRRIMDNETKIGVFCDDLILIFRQSEVKPIPLTPEILEKNEFLANKHVYPYPYYEYEVKENKVKVGFVFPQGNKTSYKEPWVYIDSERVFIEHLPCVFVHQLQHAMRLCWIEKEIEL